MGVPDMYSITVEGAKNFAAAIESEERAARLWQDRWGWILEEYKEINRQLAELKAQRTFAEEEPEPEDPRVLPVADTENHEYGLLASRPEFRLEKFRYPRLTEYPREIPLQPFYELLDKRMAERMGERK